MIITNIDFNGNTYPCRVVTSIDGEQLIIGCCELLDALQTGTCNDENDGFANNETATSMTRYFSSPIVRPSPCLTRN